MQALKFRRLDYLGKALARQMATEKDEIRRAAATATGPAEMADPSQVDVVTHVPLHWRRRAVRGFDQAEAIARPLASALDLPFESLLRRRRATAPQSRRPRRRQRSELRSAFVAPRPGRCAGRAILLVDDVLTTGSTLDDAARALRAAGARAVVAWVAARTPGPDELEPPRVGDHTPDASSV